ncbi:MAG: hypothetical protein PVF58_22255 [Candidatus Methanofastidiosia archaeon]|jgi:hypothetical protein
MRCCPECGSTDVVMRFGGKAGGLWFCKECSWQGYMIVDFPDESLKDMKEMEKEMEKIKKEIEKEMEKKMEKE